MAGSLFLPGKIGGKWATISTMLLQARFQQTLTSAYVVHPNIMTTEADKQMMIWTKTIKRLRPPEPFVTLMEEVDMEPMKNIMHNTILSSRIYEKREVRKRRNRRQHKDLTMGTHENFVTSLLQNQFKNVKGFAKTYPQLFNINPAPEVAVKATWKVLDEMMSVHGRPGTFYNAEKPLASFYTPEQVQETVNMQMDSLGPIPLFTDLNTYMIKGEPCTGFVTQPNFRYHHTLMISDNGNYKPPPSKGWPEIQLIQKGLLFTYGRLLAQAVQKHGAEIIGQVLPEPECGQCIMTDGNRFSFLWYQLNTLDLSEVNSGVKNMVCIERPGNTFAKVEEIAEHRHRLVEYNQDIVKMYLCMLLMT